MAFTFFLYGLAFFLLGIIIWLQPKAESELVLGRISWLLAAFGIVHGCCEWLQLWYPAHLRNHVYEMILVTLVVTSYAFFFEFGRRLVLSSVSFPHHSRRFLRIALGAWIYLPISLGIVMGAQLASDPLRGLNIFSRYLLCAPAGLLSAAGLLLYFRLEQAKLQSLHMKTFFYLGALGFAAYAVFGGVFGPEGAFFPANTFSETSFLARTGYPVLIFRAMSAVILAVSVGGIIRIFQFESRTRMNEALETTQRSLAEVQKLMKENEHIRSRLHLMAYYDVLTGLPNRQLFHDRLHQALAHAKRARNRVALMYLDFDRFKCINDSLGHTVGDQLLVRIAERIRACVREEDTVARLGGDEFAVILPDVVTQETVTPIAEKILTSFRHPLNIEDDAITMTVSIGIALYPDHSSDGETLVINADSAMYHAKDSGRNRYQFFETGMDARFCEPLTLDRR